MQYTLWDAELVKGMKNNTLITSINQVIQAYQTCGFKIKAILVDGQFRQTLSINNKIIDIQRLGNYQAT